MSKSLYEVFVLLEAIKKYEILANTSSEEEKTFYTNLQEQCKKLVFVSSNIIGFSCDEITKFYYEMQKFFLNMVDKDATLDNIQSLFNILYDKNAILNNFQKFDAEPFGTDCQLTYRRFVSDKPLFTKLMGEKSMQYKKQLEQIIGEPLDIERAENSLVKLGPLGYTWQNKLSEAYKNGKITEQQNNQLNSQLVYLVDYYYGIMCNDFKDLEWIESNTINRG